MRTHIEILLAVGLIIGLTFLTIWAKEVKAQEVFTLKANHSHDLSFEFNEILETPILPFYKFLSDGTDLDRLSYAVAMQETGNCEIVTNFSVKNNCHGFKWNGRIYQFDTTQGSHDYFKDLWKRKYKRFPDIKLAEKYSGGDRKEEWLNNVTYFYNL